MVSLDDEPLIAMGRAVGTAALMHLSTLTESGNFSNDLANLVLNDLSLQEVLIDNVLTTLQTKGYSGLDVDFEFVFPQDALPYAAFIPWVILSLLPWPPKPPATSRAFYMRGTATVTLARPPTVYSS